MMIFKYDWYDWYDSPLMEVCPLVREVGLVIWWYLDICMFECVDVSNICDPLKEVCPLVREFVLMMIWQWKMRIWGHITLIMYPPCHNTNILIETNLLVILYCCTTRIHFHKVLHGCCEKWGPGQGWLFGCRSSCIWPRTLRVERGCSSLDFHIYVRYRGIKMSRYQDPSESELRSLVSHRDIKMYLYLYTDIKIQTVHSRLTRVNGVWKVQKVDKRRHLFFIQ